MAVTAVIFDWGGTLTQRWLDEEQVLALWLLAAERICDGHRGDAALDPATVARHLHTTERVIWDRCLAAGDSFVLADILAEAASSGGFDVADDVRAEAVARYLDGWGGEVAHDPDAVAVLTELREQGLRTALLSNTHWPRDVHEDWLCRDGLAELLDVRCYTSDQPWMKPHPALFRAVLDEVGVPAAEAVFVGDRPTEDVAGAASVGMRTVLRTGTVAPHGGVEPDAVIDTLPELLGVLERWS